MLETHLLFASGSDLYCKIFFSSLLKKMKISFEERIKSWWYSCLTEYFQWLKLVSSMSSVQYLLVSLHLIHISGHREYTFSIFCTPFHAWLLCRLLAAEGSDQDVILSRQEPGGTTRRDEDDLCFIVFRGLPH